MNSSVFDDAFLGGKLPIQVTLTVDSKRQQCEFKNVSSTCKTRWCHTTGFTEVSTAFLSLCFENCSPCQECEPRCLPQAACFAFDANTDEMISRRTEEIGIVQHHLGVISQATLGSLSLSVSIDLGSFLITVTRYLAEIPQKRVGSRIPDLFRLRINRAVNVITSPNHRETSTFSTLDYTEYRRLKAATVYVSHSTASGSRRNLFVRRKLCWLMDCRGSAAVQGDFCPSNAPPNHGNLPDTRRQLPKRNAFRVPNGYDACFASQDLPP